MGDEPRLSIQQRVAAVKRKLPIADVVERHVKLSGTAQSRNRRGPCPFHGSSSASFSIKSAGNTENGFAHCFGCQWSGDVVCFVRDIMGLDFVGALEECERLAGISPVGATASGYLSAESRHGPIKRERNPASSSRKAVGPPPVAAIDMGRWLWRHAVPDSAAVRRYFMGRGVPAAVLTDARVAPFRYLADCPCWPWKVGEEPHPGKVKGMFLAPAIMVMVRVPVMESGVSASGSEAVGQRVNFMPVGLHVTYLNPAGDGTMVRRKPWAKADDPDAMLPKRRMLGPVGRGAVLLGDYQPGAHLWVGEGNETVLSAMALAGADEAAVGVATLSLDNLQGAPKKWKGGIWPLHAIEPDPERYPFVIPGHQGAVTGLVDSDMSELRGMRDQRTGEFQGEKLVLRKGGPIVQRAITGAERATICGDLLVKGWRQVTPGPVDALRAPAGMDFNDAVRSAVHG